MAKKPETIAHLDLAIARWETRLKVAMTKLSKLKLKRKALARRIAEVDRALSPTPGFDVTAELGKLTITRPIWTRAEISDRDLKAAKEAVAKPAENSAAVAPAPKQPEDLSIPDFLRRGQAAQKAANDAADAADQRLNDLLIANEIREEQANRKTAKARGRIATMKAKQAGDTKKMPLTGKAALAALRED
jgi:hypothetical protein